MEHFRTCRLDYRILSQRSGGCLVVDLWRVTSIRFEPGFELAIDLENEECFNLKVGEIPVEDIDRCGVQIIGQWRAFMDSDCALRGKDAP